MSQTDVNTPINGRLLPQRVESATVCLLLPAEHGMLLLQGPSSLGVCLISGGCLSRCLSALSLVSRLGIYKCAGLCVAAQQLVSQPEGC